MELPLGPAKQIVEFPYELKQNFHQNQEWKHQELTKFGLKIYRDMQSYQNVFCQELMKDDGVNRTVLIEFLTLMVENDYLDCSSDPIQKIEDVLYQIVFRKNADCSQLDLFTLMMASSSRQDEFLQVCMDQFQEQYQNSANLCLWILQNILSKADGLIQRRIKGPNMTTNSLIKFCKTAFKIIEFWSQHQFINEKNKTNFILIAGYSLKLYSKYIHSDSDSIAFPNINKFHTIWSNIVINSSFENVLAQTANAAVAVIIQLFNYPRYRIIDTIQKESTFNKLIDLSRIFGLKCQNLNIFWKTYLMKKNTISEFSSTRLPNLMKHFCCFMEFHAKDLSQIVIKFDVADNMLLLSQINSKSKDIKQMQELIQPDLNPQNQQFHTKVAKLLDIGIESLYSPIFKIKKNNAELHNILNEINRLSNLNGTQNHQVFRKKVQALNLLPIFKILLVKDSSIVTNQVGLLNGIIRFIFMHIFNKNYGHYFEDLFQIICRQLKVQIENKNSNLSVSILLSISNIVNNQLLFLKSYLLKNGSKVYIGSILRCIAKLIGVLESRKGQTVNTALYLKQLLQILPLKMTVMDYDLQMALQTMIKQLKGQDWQIKECFEKLLNILNKKQNYFYIGLIFDFAEKYSNNRCISALMKANQSIIQDLCKSSPYASQSIRSINYEIMMQALNLSLDCRQIIQNLQHIALNEYFKSSTYLQLVQSIIKLRYLVQKFLRANPYTVTIAESLTEIIRVLMIMLNKVTNTFSQFNTVSKIQRSEICKLISGEILAYTINILVKADRQTFVNYRKLINDMKNFASQYHNTRLKPLLCTVKNLITSYSHLEIKAHRLCNQPLLYSSNQQSVIMCISKAFYLEEEQDTVSYQKNQSLFVLGWTIKSFKNDLTKYTPPRVSFYNNP